MTFLIDTCVWIDFTRSRSPKSLKEFIAPYLIRTGACLAEPITFEILRHATPPEIKLLTPHFSTFPNLTTPARLWDDAAVLGQNARNNGLSIGSMDLVIAALAIHHHATVTTFDSAFQDLTAISDLKVEHLIRPPTS